MCKDCPDCSYSVTFRLQEQNLESKQRMGVKSHIKIIIFLFSPCIKKIITYDLVQASWINCGRLPGTVPRTPGGHRAEIRPAAPSRWWRSGSGSAKPRRRSSSTRSAAQTQQHRFHPEQNRSPVSTSSHPNSLDTSRWPPQSSAPRNLQRRNISPATTHRVRVQRFLSWRHPENSPLQG